MKKLQFTFALLFFGIISNAQIDSGLISIYPFNGNANDTIGNHHGNVSGAVLATDRFNTTASSYFFDRTNSNYIEIPYHSDFTPDTNSMSISLWFLIPNNDTIGSVLLSWYRCGANPTCDVPDAAAYTIQINDSNQVTFWIRGDNNNVSEYKTSQVFNDSLWHHVVAVYNLKSGKQEYYIDNQLVKTDSANIVSLTDGGLTIPLSFGRLYRTGWGSPGNYFQGKLDDIRIYKRALTTADIGSLYANFHFIDITKNRDVPTTIVFPNPFNNQLIIQNYSWNNEPIQFVMYNTLGDLIINQTLLEKKNIIDLSNIEPSFYFYLLMINNQIIKSDKLIKY